MAEFSTLLALAATMAVFAWIRHTDPKNRHAHKAPPYQGKRNTTLWWLLSMVPGGVLLLLQQNAAFVMWFAAFPLLGWLVALPKPSKAIKP